MLNPGNDQPSDCHILLVCSVSAKEFYWIKRYPQNNDYPGLEDAAEGKETYHTYIDYGRIDYAFLLII